MNRRWWLAELPFVAAVAVLMFPIGTDPAKASLVASVVGVSAVVGCFVGATSVEGVKGLRAAWILFGVGWLFVVVPTWVLPAHFGFSRSGALVSIGLSVAANLLVLIGAWWAGHAWKAAERPASVSTSARGLGFFSGLVVGLLIVGRFGWEALRAGMWVGNVRVVISCVSAVLLLGLLASVLVTARARGEADSAWPWAVLLVGAVGWLCTMNGVWHIPPEVEGAFQVLLGVSYFSAGILQRMAGAGHRATAPAITPAASPTA